MKRWYFRHQKGVLYLWHGVGSAAVLGAEIALILQGYEVSLPGLLIPYVLWVLAGLAGFFVLSFRSCQGAVKQLNEACDPEPLRRWAEGELDYWSRRRCRRSYLALCAMNRATALSALGRGEEALRVQREVDPAALKAPYQTLYYGNLAIYLLQEQRLLEARTALTQAWEQYRAHPLPAGTAGPAQTALRQAQVMLSMCLGQTEGAEEELNALLREAGCQYRQVSLHFSLAQLALRENRPEKTKVHLEYAAAHGNRLALRAQAEELLKKMP